MKSDSRFNSCLQYGHGYIYATLKYYDIEIKLEFYFLGYNVEGNIIGNYEYRELSVGLLESCHKDYG